MGTEILDPTTAYWRDQCRSRVFVAQHCGVCGAWQHYPRPLCLSCSSLDLSFREISGRASVYSATTVHLPLHSTLEPPYVCALVDLDEGPRLLTNIIAGAATIGSRVCLAWLEVPGDLPLPVFRPDGGETS